MSNNPTPVFGGPVGGTNAGPVAKSRQAGDVIHPSHYRIVPGSVHPETISRFSHETLDELDFVTDL